MSIGVISRGNERGRRCFTASAGAGGLVFFPRASFYLINYFFFFVFCVCVFASITAVLSNKCGFQLQYQMIFCVWLLAFSPQLCEQLRRYNVVPALSDILQESVKEKVTRIILAAFRVRGKHFKQYFATFGFSSFNSWRHRFGSLLLWLACDWWNRCKKDSISRFKNDLKDILQSSWWKTIWSFRSFVPFKLFLIMTLNIRIHIIGFS